MTARGQLSFVLFLILFTVVPEAWARTLSKPGAGYTIDVPDDWITVPDATLQLAMQAVQKSPDPNKIRLDLGAQPAVPARPILDYPYVLVQTLPYAGNGISQQIPEHQFENVIKAMTGANVQKQKDIQFTPEVAKAMTNLVVGPARLDVPGRRFVVSTVSRIEGVGPVRSTLYGFFGHEALVQVVCTEAGETTPGFAAAGKAIADSFRFDAAHQYNEQEASIGRASETGRRVGELMGKFACSLLPALIIFFAIRNHYRRYKQREANAKAFRQPPPLPPKSTGLESLPKA